MVADVLVHGPRNDTNISHLKTSVISTDWNNWNPKLKFPTTSSEKQYKMANLHLDRGIFVFDFLRKFLSLIQPYDVPVGKVYNLEILFIILYLYLCLKFNEHFVLIS